MQPGLLLGNILYAAGAARPPRPAAPVASPVRPARDGLPTLGKRR